MSQFAELLAAKNHFELFRLPVQYPLDRQLLHSQYLTLTRETHPDAVGGDEEQQMQAMQLSARINDAFATLDDDFRRAEYLLHLLTLRGQTPGAVKLPPDLLDRIFELREALSFAQSRDDQESAGQIRKQAGQWLAELLTQFGATGDLPRMGELLEAARYVRRVARS
jgi:molecular chaperone HscB